MLVLWRTVTSPLSAESTTTAHNYTFGPADFSPDLVPPPEHHVTVHVPAEVYEANVFKAQFFGERSESLPVERVVTSVPVARPVSAAEALFPAPPAVKSELKQDKRWIFFDSAWQGSNDSLPTDYVRVHLFTLAWGAVFCGPVAIALGLAKDATVQYFVGYIGLFALLVPFLMTVGYVYHVRAGRLRIEGMFISTVIPALLLASIGQAHMMGTSKVLQDLLMSKDCVTYEPKVQLQRSWALADTILDECREDVQKKLQAKRDLFGSGIDHAENGKSSAAAINLPKLEFPKIAVEDCKRYRAALSCSSFWGSRDSSCSREGIRFVEHLPDWTYLKKMEVEQHCSGWCSYERPVWTLRETRDSCTVVSADVIRTKVRPMAFQLLMMSFVILFASFFCIYLAQRGHLVGHLDEAMDEYWGLAMKKNQAKIP